MLSYGGGSLETCVEKKNILLVIPDERKVYQDVHVKVGAFHLPSLAYAILGAIAQQNGYVPHILDLTIHDNHEAILKKELSTLKPKFVGLTGTTAIFFHTLEISNYIKSLDPTCPILIGGAHASSTVEDTLKEKSFDFVFIGEAEDSFAKFLQGCSPEKINGIAFRLDDGTICRTPQNPYISDLDSYPMPAYELYDFSKYRISKIHAKRQPVLWIETSRGCPFNCKICNKIVHGQNFRPKSAQRVVSEISSFHKLGVREFYIADDGFTTHIKRAERICDQLINNGLNITWACTNGIRVDRITLQLLKKMKEAGCYRVSFGIESGNQSILNSLGKKTTLAQVEQAVGWAREVGIEVFGFFMFGFLDDTIETMQDTIRFAKKLPLDLAKASLIMPFPGSPLHDEYKAKNLLSLPGDYRKYNVYTSPRHVYRHPQLEWDIIEEFQKKFYRSFYFNPRYMIRRLISAIKSRSLLINIKAALTMKWFRKY